MGKYTCNICNFTCNKIYYFNAHLNTHKNIEKNNKIIKKSNFILNPYGWEIAKNINNIETEFNNKDCIRQHFKYKDTYFFYYRKLNSKYLLIFFHGAIDNRVTLPVYRGYNYKIDNADILSINDNFLIKYSTNRLLLSWFLSTNIVDNDIIYIKIIESIINCYPYKKILFLGSSGGGYPALKYSSYFNQYALIQNSQIYLDKYPYYKEMIDIIEDNDNKIIYNNIDIFFKKYGAPKKIYLFQNKLDTHHYTEHYIPFKKFMDITYPNKLDEYIFENSGHATKSNHKLNLPTNLDFYKCLNLCLSKND